MGGGAVKRRKSRRRSDFLATFWDVTLSEDWLTIRQLVALLAVFRSQAYTWVPYSPKLPWETYAAAVGHFLLCASVLISPHV